MSPMRHIRERREKAEDNIKAAAVRSK